MTEPFQVVDVEHFLHVAEGPIIDVRSPCEFSSGHIPGSHSVPLFSDVERACIGTMYKRFGHDDALMAGLQTVGPKLGSLAASIRAILKASKSTSCRVTCFRGGMRSRSIQWLCDFLGFSTVRLDGGYKSFRRHVLQTFEHPFNFVVIGGQTGSGKTRWMRSLKEEGCQSIDLERLAEHRGSAFGLLPGVLQPTTEQFENLLALQLWEMDAKRCIFVEDESRRIGSCMIPKAIFDQMDRSKFLWLQVDEETRLKHIVESYGAFPGPWLIECTKKLEKRLGRERVLSIVSLIENGSIEGAARLLLEYYDHAYLYSRERRPREHKTVTSDELLIEAKALGCSLTVP